MTERMQEIRNESKRLYGFGTDRMRELKVCTHCGTMTGATRIFCPECSKLLPRDTVYTLYKKRHRCCKFCGNVVSKLMHFCPNCGQSLNEA